MQANSQLATHHSQLKIAVFRALHLGDLLVAVPALRALRAGFPQAEITLIGLPWAEEVVRRFHAYLDRFLPFPGYPGIAEAPLDPAQTTRFIEEQRAYRYDLVVQMHGSGRASNPFVLALGGRVTAGYYDPLPSRGPSAGSYDDDPCPSAGHTYDGHPHNSHLTTRNSQLTLAAPYPHDQPEVVRNLGLALLLGCPSRGLEMEFPLCDGDRAEAAALLKSSQKPVASSQKEASSRKEASHWQWTSGNRPLVCIHPGARAPARRWPAERFAAVAGYMIRRWGAQIVLTGGPGEEDTARAVAAYLAGEGSSPALNLAGRTSLGGLAAVIARADLFISNDTGPAHLAVAVGTPSVTIFGPADHRRWAPLDRTRHPVVRHPVACSPCSYRDCPIDHRCLYSIAPTSVIAAAEELLVSSCEL